MTQIRDRRVVLRAAYASARYARTARRHPEAIDVADAWVVRARARLPWWARIDIDWLNR